MVGSGGSCSVKRRTIAPGKRNRSAHVREMCGSLGTRSGYYGYATEDKRLDAPSNPRTLVNFKKNDNER